MRLKQLTDHLTLFVPEAEWS